MYIQHLWLRLKCLLVFNNNINTNKIIQGYTQRYCEVIRFNKVDSFLKKKLQPKCVDMLMKIGRQTYWLLSKQNLCFSCRYIQYVICHNSTVHMPPSKVSVVSRPKVGINGHENNHELNTGLSIFTHQLSKQKFYIF